MVEYKSNYTVQLAFTNHLLQQSTPYFEGLAHLKYESVQQLCAERLTLLNGTKMASVTYLQDSSKTSYEFGRVKQEITNSSN